MISSLSVDIPIWENRSMDYISQTNSWWIKDNNKAIEFYKIIKFILEDIASFKNETTEESDLNKNNIQSNQKSETEKE